MLIILARCGVLFGKKLDRHTSRRNIEGQSLRGDRDALRYYAHQARCEAKGYHGGEWQKALIQSYRKGQGNKVRLNM